MADGDARSFQHPVFMEAFTYLWEGAMAGEPILDSRATDLDGTVRPVAAGLKRKKTFLEDIAQFPFQCSWCRHLCTLPTVARENANSPPKCLQVPHKSFPP